MKKVAKSESIGVIFFFGPLTVFYLFYLNIFVNCRDVMRQYFRDHFNLFTSLDAWCFYNYRV